ncbi:hypothetical protein LguiB_033772 [Lonicera macranthoides]
MALSYYSNYLNSEMKNIFPQIQTELTSELLNFQNNFTFADTCIDPLFEQPESFAPQNALPPPPSDHLLDPLPPDPFFYPQCPPNPNFIPHEYNGILQNPHPLPPSEPEIAQEILGPVLVMSPEILGPLPDILGSVPEMLPEILGPLPEISTDILGPVVFEKKQSVSAQSMAARQRRRKISEKTQELGKLIPGGQKMNTAEMLQAASKYVKFLQAQVGILEIMGSIQENEEPMKSKELQVLVTSPLIQEKLYSEEKCLVPKQFVKALTNDVFLQSNPWIHKEINLFLQSIDK